MLYKLNVLSSKTEFILDHRPLFCGASFGEFVKLVPCIDIAKVPPGGNSPWATGRLMPLFRPKAWTYAF